VTSEAAAKHDWYCPRCWNLADQGFGVYWCPKCQDFCHDEHAAVYATAEYAAKKAEALP